MKYGFFDGQNYFDVVVFLYTKRSFKTVQKKIDINLDQATQRLTSIGNIDCPNLKFAHRAKFINLGTLLNSLQEKPV